MRTRTRILAAGIIDAVVAAARNRVLKLKHDGGKHQFERVTFAVDSESHVEGWI